MCHQKMRVPVCSGNQKHTLQQGWSVCIRWRIVLFYKSWLERFSFFFLWNEKALTLQVWEFSEKYVWIILQSVEPPQDRQSVLGVHLTGVRTTSKLWSVMHWNIVVPTFGLWKMRWSNIFLVIFLLYSFCVVKCPEYQRFFLAHSRQKYFASLQRPKATCVSSEAARKSLVQSGFILHSRWTLINFIGLHLHQSQGASPTVITWTGTCRHDMPTDDMTDLVWFELRGFHGNKNYSVKKVPNSKFSLSWRLFDIYVVCNGGYYSLVSEMFKNWKFSKESRHFSLSRMTICPSGMYFL